MSNFKKLNNIGGIIALIFGTAVYTMTMEASASLWDCGEFIAACYKQLVVHPPGAALFLMIGRVFTLFAPSPQSVALSINFMSALCSGLAMMFLFWITTYLARKILTKNGQELSGSNMWIVLASGLIAAMTGTFCDTIWFSAVEGEVYSMSLMFTALVFWLMTKWEQHADEPYADRYLLLIAFLMGCSIFVHWLNLLTIPAIALMYYFHRYQPTTKGAIIALLVGFIILLLFMQVVITGAVDFIAAIELLFVNSFGLPFNSGVWFALLIIIAAFVGSLFYTYKKSYVTLHNIILGFMFILIGYSTVTTIVIRSISEPSINMNDPSDPISLAAYLHREQYGSRPLFLGYFYNDNPTDIVYTGVRYQKGETKYDEVGKKFDYAYEKSSKKLFPRIHDNKSKDLYERWLGLRKNQDPSYFDNIKYFFIYQLNYMYVRYFMWNFVGRQNDEQGVGLGDDGLRYGNWLSGIPFLDNILNGFLEPQNSSLPEYVKNNPSRATFFFLPLLLGLLGLVYQAVNDRRRFYIILILFLMTGVVFILYGNAPPLEPRERDYIYAGSFFTFSMWVGLGCMALFDMLRKYIKGNAGVALSFALCLIVPFLMGSQGWVSHDRSGRTAARDFAADYLNSCAPNAIIFTQGDNDTYPLWYAQEVEGIRRDVRVVNLSLLGVDWYINQCRKKLNDADGVKMTLQANQIAGSKRDVTYYVEDTRIAPADRYIDLKQIISFIGDDKAAQLTSSGERMNYYPTKKMQIPVDSLKVIANGTVQPEDMGLIVPQLTFELKKNSLLKNDLAVLDIIASNNWERPVYFAISVERGAYMGLEKYFQLEGLAYRLVPIEAKSEGNSPYLGRVQTKIMADNLLNKFSFGNLEKPDVYANNDMRRMLYNFRNNYVRLADAFIEEGKPEKAKEVLDRSLEFIPERTVPFDLYAYSMVASYYDVKDYEKGNEIIDKITDRLIEDLNYYKSLSPSMQKVFERDQQMAESFLMQFARSVQQAGQTEFYEKLENKIKGM